MATWRCPSCSLLNSVDLARCRRCDAAQGDSGPPLAAQPTPAPRVGAKGKARELLAAGVVIGLLGVGMVAATASRAMAGRREVHGQITSCLRYQKRSGEVVRVELMLDHRPEPFSVDPAQPGLGDVLDYCAGHSVVDLVVRDYWSLPSTRHDVAVLRWNGRSESTELTYEQSGARSARVRYGVSALLLGAAATCVLGAIRMQRRARDAT